MHDSRDHVNDFRKLTEHNGIINDSLSESEFNVEKYVKMLAAVSKLSSQLISAIDFDAAINKVLSDLGMIADADRSYLFLLRDNGKRLDNTHEWCAAGVNAQIDNLKDLDAATYQWWMKKLNQNEVIHISDVSQMPQTAKAEQEILMQQDIKSLIVFPVFSKGLLAGFVGFDNIKTKGFWSNYAVTLLYITSGIIGSTIERFEMERTLTIKEQAISSSINAMALADLDGNITYVNRSFLNMWKHENESDVIGRSIIDFFSPDQQADQVINTVKEKGAWTGNLIGINKDGSIFHVHLSASRVEDNSGNPVCLVASLVDITARIQARNELMASEQKLLHMFQDVTDAITVTDLNGIITELNDRAIKLHGYDSKKELIGKNAFVLIASSDHEKAAANMQKTAAEGAIQGVEYILVRKDGTEFLAELSASVLKDASGNPTGFVAITRDITERKKFERELVRFATTDELTGVMNRRSGLLLFRQQLQLAKRNDQKLTVCYVDIDFLKLINDIYSHAEGDEVLKTVSSVIKQTIRQIDIVCRLGGDEFLIVFPQATAQQALAIWNRIMDEVDLMNSRKTKPYSISLSRGFAEYDPTDEKSADQLVSIADKEMYAHKRAKFQSKNQT